jgi:pSer/pThr/pTyr-binding forkhead associated (FHA) protein
MNDASIKTKEDTTMKCKECQMENIEGALFCEECGSKLEGNSALLEASGEVSSQLVLAASDGNRLEIPAKDDIIIGREDPISDIFPDLDLTDLGGMDKGVSRKHAVIHRAGKDYTVEDMGSTNGTYVNKKKIMPHAPQAIKPGDELRFGKLSLSVQAA